MQTSQFQSHYHADHPVSTNSEDRFQRYNFSKRIAQTILSSSSPDALVIGIYGSWGEGKTSVLNFIEQELKEDPNQIIVKFNPWRFSDESTLLIQFFSSLAKSIDGKLKSGTEVFGSYLKKYSQLINFNIPGVGNPGKGIEGLGHILDSAGLEDQKKVVNDAILKAGKRITVIIDDIDRLERSEIQTIFRLVKLNADFANTTYILSFDEKMVSAAIGERFGGGGEEAGKSFLEKIIQVPLRLPMIRTELIQLFCIQQIESHLSRHGISLDEYDRKRYIEVFSAAILPRLNTPRIATRYSNTLSFSIPLLNGEVNIMELMIIEALKIFYPQSYNVVRYNPDVFLSTRFVGEDDVTNLGVIDEKLSNCEDSATDRQHARLLINSLFPEATNQEHNQYTARINYNRRSIASPNYFERYFTYAVIHGDLSDVSVKAFVSGKYDADQLLKELNGFLTNNPANLFLSKLAVAALYATDEEKESLGILLSNNSNLFSDKQDEAWGGLSPFINAAEVVKSVIAEVPQERLWATANKVLAPATDMRFILEVLSRCLEDASSSFIRQSEADKQIFHRIMIDKALELSGEKMVFEAFPDYTAYLFKIWQSFAPTAFDSYIKKVFGMREDAYGFLLISLVQPVHAGLPRNLNRSKFNSITSLVDRHLIADQIRKRYSKRQLSTPVQFKNIRADADLNAMILRLSLQFMANMQHTPDGSN